MESLEAVLRDYVGAASGVVETSRERARVLALRLVDAGAATREQAGHLADDIVTTAASARANLVATVRAEVARALPTELPRAVQASVADIARQVSDSREAQLARLTTRVAALEVQLAALRARSSEVPEGAPDAGEPSPVATPGQVEPAVAGPTLPIGAAEHTAELLVQAGPDEGADRP